MEFSKKLYELRKQKGHSQEELAGKLNVSRQTLSKWELGESTPDMEKLILICDYFDISMDELVLGKEIEKKIVKQENDIVKILTEKILTDDNKKKTKKKLKLVGIIFAIVFCVDFLTAIIYFIVYGVPK